jgi:hypothetical protein
MFKSVCCWVLEFPIGRIQFLVFFSFLVLSHAGTHPHIFGLSINQIAEIVQPGLSVTVCLRLWWFRWALALYSLFDVALPSILRSATCTVSHASLNPIWKHEKCGRCVQRFQKKVSHTCPQSILVSHIRASINSQGRTERYLVGGELKSLAPPPWKFFSTFPCENRTLQKNFPNLRLDNGGLKIHKTHQIK